MSLTINQYLERAGLHCPNCESSEGIESAPRQSDGTCAWANVLCNKCSSCWIDEYALVAYGYLRIQDVLVHEITEEEVL